MTVQALHKICRPQGEWRSSRPDSCTGYKWDNWYEVQQTSGPARLCIAAREGHIDLLKRLAAELTGRLGLLYVLHTSRCENELGRYEAMPLEFQIVSQFLDRFADYLQQDARHDLWVGTVNNSGTLVYDRHNLIYAYGLFDGYMPILEQGHFRHRPIVVPSPHCHHYHEAYDHEEQATIQAFNWRRTPLQPQDKQVDDEA